VHDAVLVAKAALEATLRKNDSLFRKNFRHGELYNKVFNFLILNSKFF